MAGKTYGEYYIRPVNTRTGLKYRPHWNAPVLSYPEVTDALFNSALAAEKWMQEQYPQCVLVPHPTLPEQAPSLPYAPGSATSHEAAAVMRPEAGRLRESVYDFILKQGPRGATRQEIITAFGSTMQSIGPRVVELRAAGRVYEPGDTRPARPGAKTNATVIIAVPRGEATEPVKSPRERKLDTIIAAGEALYRRLNDALERSHECEPAHIEALDKWRKAVAHVSS